MVWIQSLVQELPYAVVTTIKLKKKKKRILVYSHGDAFFFGDYSRKEGFGTYGLTRKFSKI